MGRELVVYLNGAFVPESQARLPVTDHSILFGDGLFDAWVCWEGKIHKLEAHLGRLYRGARALSLEVPLAPAAFAEAIVETVRRNGLRTAYIKALVTRGVGREPRLDPRGCTPTVVVLVGPWMSLGTADARRERGLRLVTSAVRRTPPECLDPQVKSLNYLNLILGRLSAIVAGVDDALFLDLQGRVCEGTGFNVFAVQGGELVTPRANVLKGITRQTIFELAAREGIPAREGDLTLYDLYGAEEVFLTSTSVAVLGVADLDGRKIGAGAPGPLTRRLYDLFLQELTEGRNSTPVFA